MRQIILALAALATVQPTDAADLARELAKCSAELNSITRLGCYDALGGKAVAQDQARSTSTVSKWTVQTETSRIDDSKNVTLTLEAETPIQGWPGKTFTPQLHIRCKERKTEAYVVTGMTPTVEYGTDGATVTLRLDKQRAFKVETSKSTDGEALFFPQSAPFAKRLASADTLLFQFIPFNSTGQMTTFDLRGLAEALRSVRVLNQICPKWKTGSTDRKNQQPRRFNLET